MNNFSVPEGKWSLDPWITWFNELPYDAQLRVCRDRDMTTIVDLENGAFDESCLGIDFFKRRYYMYVEMLKVIS